MLLLPACDAGVTAEIQATPEPVVAEANMVAVGDGNAEVAVAAEADAAVAVAVAAGADAAVVANADAKLEIAADAFKLGEVTTLIKEGTIESAAELELAVNDPEADFNRVDIDLDGQIDHVQVVEVRSDARVDFQFRVIPSSRASIEHSLALATASMVAVEARSEVTFSASFAASVGFSAGVSAQASAYTFVAPARFEASAVVVGTPLLTWAFVVDRPVYASLYVEVDSGRWIPPGHLKHGLWKATGGLPPGWANGGHGKFKGEFDGRGEFGGEGNGHFKGGGHGKAKGGGQVGLEGGGHGGAKHGGAEHGGAKHGGEHHGGEHHGGEHHGGASHGANKGGGGHGSADDGGSHGGGGGKGGGGSKGGGGGHGGGGKGKK